jgi:hypothetical protein
MGGKQSSEISRTEIQTSINTQITNLTKNVSDILNETITESTMNVVNENTQSISNNTGAMNTAMLGDINVSGVGSEFDLNQELDVTATNTAVANMTQDASAMSKLANQINTDVMNKIQNDSTMTQAMQAAANLQKTQSSAGGINDMIANATKMIGDVLTPGTKMDKTTETKITNSMTASLSNTTINENTIKALVQNTITNNITQKNTASCTSSIMAGNNLTVGNVNVTKGGKAKLSQIASVTALSSCVIGAAQTSKLASDITSGSVVSATTDTSNKAQASTNLKADTTIIDKTETHDAFGVMISSVVSSYTNSLMIGGVVCVCICIIIIIIMFVLPMMSGSNSSSDSSSDSSSE